MLGSIFRHGNLFYVHVRLCEQHADVHDVKPITMAVVADQKQRHALLWSARLGGLSVDDAQRLASSVKGLAHGIDEEGCATIGECGIDARAIDHCELRTMTRMRTPSLPLSSPADKVADKPGDRMVLDGWPMTHAPQVGSGNTYLMLNADDATGLGIISSTKLHRAPEWILFIQRSQAAQKMLNRDVELLAVRTDNAGEFRNVEGFADALVKTTGAVHETTPSRHHHAVGK
eukprot:1231141-Prymnesium_polylepis.1